MSKVEGVVQKTMRELREDANEAESYRGQLAAFVAPMEAVTGMFCRDVHRLDHDKAFLLVCWVGECLGVDRLARDGEVAANLCGVSPSWPEEKAFSLLHHALGEGGCPTHRSSLRGPRSEKAAAELCGVCGRSMSSRALLLHGAICGVSGHVVCVRRHVETTRGRRPRAQPQASPGSCHILPPPLLEEAAGQAVRVDPMGAGQAGGSRRQGW